MNSRLIRQSDAIYNLICSSKNTVIVKEELGQFDHVFKQLVKVYEECHSLLEEKDKLESEEWLEKVDECVFSFDHGVHNWLKDAEIEEVKSATHSSNKGATSQTFESRSSSSHSSCKSNSSKARALEEKAKLAELMAGVEFLQKQQIEENQAEQLRIRKKKKAKASAKTQVYDEMEDNRSFIQSEKAHAAAGEIKDDLKRHQQSTRSHVNDSRRSADIRKHRREHEEPARRGNTKLMPTTVGEPLLFEHFVVTPIST